MIPNDPDVIFLLGIEGIFRAALCILKEHKKVIMSCHSFETIMEFMRSAVPNMTNESMNRILINVFKINIQEMLTVYEIEYHVVQEEMLISMTSGPNQQSFKSTQSKSVQTLKETPVELKEMEIQTDPIHKLSISTSPLPPVNIMSTFCQSTETSFSSNVISGDTSSIPSLDQSLEEKDKLINQLQTEIKSIQSENSQLMDQLHVASSSIRILEDSVDGHKSTMKRLEVKIHTLEDERDALLNANSNMRRRCEKLESEVSDMKLLQQNQLQQVSLSQSTSPEPQVSSLMAAVVTSDAAAADGTPPPVSSSSGVPVVDSNGSKSGKCDAIMQYACITTTGILSFPLVVYFQLMFHLFSLFLT